MRKKARNLLGLAAAILVLLAGTLPAAANLPANTIVSTRDGLETATVSWEGRPTLLVFFSPACPYCRSELKELEKLSNWPVSEGLRIVAVAPGEWPARVLNAVSAKWGLKGLEIFRDPGNALFKAYRVKKIPYTVYLGADGNRKDAFMGAATAAQLEEFLQGVRN